LLFEIVGAGYERPVKLDKLASAIDTEKGVYAIEKCPENRDGLYLAQAHEVPTLTEKAQSFLIERLTSEGSSTDAVKAKIIKHFLKNGGKTLTQDQRK